ncbi:hypothetical protein AMAG_14758 [Allomyces macrogynus ATCC 38327]|uniref:Hsp70-like protein n=1 Tax=Allomyces macrogynus (strain ATCC 38327) TaxID=578462 RepID=A0A0L0T5R6_ALLM3|nr:hypothetical protein AMAG_14758 [Allomyces macrogynus ATCC 38327]|eukprot:KNE69909.1 hypothetical protein AMAG_14758 [Allomyces macrogynus ATCC 38327]
MAIVPVGWSSQAHQSMRSAATKAGLISNEKSWRLLFCYEPEAAALACIHESSFTITGSPKLMFVDCGGGTVDLFLARFNGDKKLEELTLGTGNFHGATSVDAQFMKFLANKIGDRAFQEYKYTVPFHFARLRQEWESKKCAFSGTQKWILQLPHALVKLFPTDKNAELRDCEIQVSAADMKSIIDPVVDEIISLICAQLEQARKLDGAKVQYLYLVGGFGSNPYLRDHMKGNSVIQEMVGSVVSLQKPDAAVVRGAVWFCLNNELIQMRRARKTVGIGVQRKFDPWRDHKSEITSYDPNDPTVVFVPKGVLCFMSKNDAVAHNASFTKGEFSDSKGAVLDQRLNVDDCTLSERSN